MPRSCCLADEYHRPAGGDDAMPSDKDRAFIALQDAYRPHGGLSRLHSLAAGGSVRSEGRDGGVEQFVEAGKLFGFRWHLDFWLPMFQFDLPGSTVAAGPQRVTAEWGQSLDGWALASWFVRPNVRLEGSSPVECLASRLPEVLEAAHADRPVAIG